MKNDNSFSSSNKETQPLCFKPIPKRNLTELLAQTSAELTNLSNCIGRARQVHYNDASVDKLAQKIIHKYNSPLVIIDKYNLSIKKTFWIMAEKYLDLTSYEADLIEKAHTLPLAEFSSSLTEVREKIFLEINLLLKRLVAFLNKSVGNGYIFAFSNVTVKNFSFDNEEHTLSMQLTFDIDIK